MEPHDLKWALDAIALGVTKIVEAIDQTTGDDVVRAIDELAGVVGDPMASDDHLTLNERLAVLAQQHGHVFQVNSKLWGDTNMLLARIAAALEKDAELWRERIYHKDGEHVTLGRPAPLSPDFVTTRNSTTLDDKLKDLDLASDR